MLGGLLGGWRWRHVESHVLVAVAGLRSAACRADAALCCHAWINLKTMCFNALLFNCSSKGDMNKNIIDCLLGFKYDCTIQMVCCSLYLIRICWQNSHIKRVLCLLARATAGLSRFRHHALLSWNNVFPLTEDKCSWLTSPPVIAR